MIKYRNYAHHSGRTDAEYFVASNGRRRLSVCFMEVSSHAIEQRRIAGLNFEGGIFTNLTRDHMDYHLTFENYLKAKNFLDQLPKESFALVNVDDKNGLVMVQNSKARKFTYSMRGMADFKTRILEHGFDGMLLDMNDKEVSVSFIGKFNAANLTAVFGTAVLLGVDETEALRVISMLKAVSGRFETVSSPSGFTAIVDYAHTPDALNNVISTINQILQGSGRLITVVGCGGNRDKGKRPLMAREAVDGSWKAIFTSDNPRNEDPQSILDDMIGGLDATQKSKHLSIINRREAIKTACALAQSGDVVLIAGKGHEEYQLIQGVNTISATKKKLRLQSIISLIIKNALSSFTIWINVRLPGRDVQLHIISNRCRFYIGTYHVHLVRQKDHRFSAT